MDNKTIKLSSKDIITKRDQLSKDITKYWKIIKQQNVMSKKAIAAGLATYDLNHLHNQILQMSLQRIQCKLLLNAINNNIEQYDDTTNIHYKTIFEANELKEQLAQWEIVLKSSTINPATKAKAGAKGTGKKEIFSSAKITSIKKKLELQITALNKKIADFNDTTTIEVNAEKFGEFFQA